MLPQSACTVDGPHCIDSLNSSALQFFDRVAQQDREFGLQVLWLATGCKPGDMEPARWGNGASGFTSHKVTVRRSTCDTGKKKTSSS
jgi:hypothetical protein